MMKVLDRFVFAVVFMTFAPSAWAESEIEFRLLATNKTSTMEKEMNEAAAEGFQFNAVMGGDTSFGGAEVVLIMKRHPGEVEAGRYQYRLLATNKTSTMQKELQGAADRGFHYCGQTVFSTAFGGNEVVIILQRDRNSSPGELYEYKLLATSKTSTMQRELTEEAEKGFELAGLTVGETSFGGNELVAILKRTVE